MPMHLGKSKKSKELIWLQIYYSKFTSLLFVCVEVLQPSQPNGVISSVVSLPNHTLLGRLSPLSG